MKLDLEATFELTEFEFAQFQLKFSENCQFVLNFSWNWRTCQFSLKMSFASTFYTHFTT